MVTSEPLSAKTRLMLAWAEVVANRAVTRPKALNRKREKIFIAFMFREASEKHLMQSTGKYHVDRATSYRIIDFQEGFESLLAEYRLDPFPAHGVHSGQCPLNHIFSKSK